MSGDVDVAQIYDHSTGCVLMQLEDFGFCKRGEGGLFVESGALAWRSGSLPTNTHGGSLSEAYIHGGAPVELVWEDMSADLAVPRFRLASPR